MTAIAEGETTIEVDGVDNSVEVPVTVIPEELKMHKVLIDFSDLEDKKHVYRKGDVFPRKGKKVTKKRIAELLSADNKRGLPLIEEVKE